MEETREETFSCPKCGDPVKSLVRSLTETFLVKHEVGYGNMVLAVGKSLISEVYVHSCGQRFSSSSDGPGSMISPIVPRVTIPDEPDTEPYEG